MNILIIFGSESDAYVYEPICQIFSQSNAVDFEVISAHRHPVRLSERLAEENYDLVIAGAGISAHLPGVVASKVACPVYGVPVEAQFGGLDALMSIQMMPFGVPVLTCGPKKAELFKAFIEGTNAIRPDWDAKIAVIIEPSLHKLPHAKKELSRLKKLASEQNIDLIFSNSPADTIPRIRFVSAAGEATNHPLEIAVPLLDAESRKNPMVGISCFEWTLSGGLWMGVNNSRNALLFFIKVFTGA
jgi:5-(carboxyamino)imidazole ribonucleotide mutase